MARRPRPQRGFTLIEIAIVVAVIAVVTALAYPSIARQRPRASLATTASEVHALLHGARLSAMASGRNVIVMVFPAFANPLGGTGRLVLYEDGDFDFFSAAAAVNFDAYNPAVATAGARSQVLDTLDLPRDVRVGPVDGMGLGAVLVAPLDGIDVTRACSFCGGLADGRGAVLFDPRGRAAFYGANGPPAAVNKGASLSLNAPDLQGWRTMVITSGTGAVRTLTNG